MQWTGIAANHAERVAEKHHQLLKRSAARDGVSVFASCFDGSNAMLFAGTLIQNAAQSERGVNLLTEFPVALRRPALGAPSTRGAQHHITIHVEIPQDLQGRRLMRRRHRKRERDDAAFGASAQRKLAVLLSNVCLRSSNTVGVKKRHAEFANGVRRESDSPAYAAQKRKRCRLPEALIINRRRESALSNAAQNVANGTERACLHFPDFRNKFTAGDQ